MLTAMTSYPLFLSLLFALTTSLSVWLFYRAAHHATPVLLSLLGWLALHGMVALAGFYAVVGTLPPRPLLLLLPSLLVIGGLFGTGAGRRFLSGLRPDRLLLVHVVRVPVELGLLGLYLHGGLPRLMTFEGRNWDILAGLSAPLVYYLVFRRRSWGRGALLGWNLLGLGLLLNIVVSAVLAMPTPWQRWGFEQPNVALLHFPFVWLPGCIVPLVLLAHLTAIWQLRPGAAARFDDARQSAERAAADAGPRAAAAV